MRKKIIVGNWKMFKTPQEARQLAKSIKIKLTDIRKTEIAVCPPYVAIAPVLEVLKDARIGIGAQNVYVGKTGAFTGEISAPMLKDAGCRFVLIGHSERRQYFHESNASVNQKTECALAEELTPIVCIGETLEEREKDLTESVITHQFTDGLKGLREDQFLKLIIAYEPVWAIGTGRNATVEQAQDVHKIIRRLASSRFGTEASESVRLLYGGSVKPENARELLACADIDGALVGGASLDADAFSAIVRTAEEIV